MRLLCYGRRETQGLHRSLVLTSVRTLISVGGRTCQPLWLSRFFCFDAEAVLALADECSVELSLSDDASTSLSLGGDASATLVLEEEACKQGD